MTTTHSPGNSRPRFSLGRLVATPGALAELEELGVAPAALLARHQLGDWGDVCPEDHTENELALGRHLRIFSVYRLTDTLTIWIITEADRSATTIVSVQPGSREGAGLPATKAT